mmetsp:Transcript_772/g.963  ORF Transcript_772/g.963 Transcript_772/m.963 type:complete len:260 (-) Transcript_772:120-899(-)
MLPTSSRESPNFKLPSSPNNSVSAMNWIASDSIQTKKSPQVLKVGIMENLKPLERKHPEIPKSPNRIESPSGSTGTNLVKMIEKSVVIKPKLSAARGSKSKSPTDQYSSRLSPSSVTRKVSPSGKSTPKKTINSPHFAKMSTPASKRNTSTFSYQQSFHAQQVQRIDSESFCQMLESEMKKNPGFDVESMSSRMTSRMASIRKDRDTHEESRLASGFKRLEDKLQQQSTSCMDESAAPADDLMDSTLISVRQGSCADDL